jgi:hypothetical protein
MNIQSRGNGLRVWIFSLQPCFFSSEDRGKIWATHPFTKSCSGTILGFNDYGWKSGTYFNSRESYRNIFEDIRTEESMADIETPANA